MARSKKSRKDADSLLTSLRNLDAEEDLELPEELEEALAADLAEADDDFETETELEIEASEDGDLTELTEEEEPVEEEPPPRKARKAARSRKKKPKKKSAGKTGRRKSSKGEAEPDEGEVSVPAELSAETPETVPLEAPSKPAGPEPREKTAEPAAEATPETMSPEVPEGKAPAASADIAAVNLREDVSVTSVSLHQSMDTMVKQWASVKDISGTICQNFERVNQMLQEIPAQQKRELQQIAKATRRAPMATRLAIGVSAAAIVLSLVSLTLVSSTRQAVLMEGTPALAESDSGEGLPANRRSPGPEMANRAPVPVPAAPRRPRARAQRSATEERTRYRKKPSVAYITERKRGYAAPAP